MRNIIFFLMLLLSSFHLNADIQPLSPKDENDIRAQFQALYTAWNQHDGKAIAELFTNDGSLRTNGNKEGNTHKEIAAVLNEQFDRHLKDAQIEGEITSIQLVKPDVAFVDGESIITGIKGGDQNPNSRLRHHIVFLLVKKDGHWKFLIGRPF